MKFVNTVNADKYSVMHPNIGDLFRVRERGIYIIDDIY